MDTNWILYSGVGAVGGVLTTLEWVDKTWSKPENADMSFREKLSLINPFKVVRNLTLGAIAGGMFGTPTNSMSVALMTGTAGEFYLQKAGKTMQAKFPIINKIPLIT